MGDVITAMNTKYAKRRKKVPSSRRKKPVTTWLTPTEIKSITPKGGDAQDGIRSLVRGATRSTVSNPKAIKKSRSTPIAESMTEILCLPTESQKVLARRLLSRG